MERQRLHGVLLLFFLLGAAVSLRAYEAREICKDVGLADGPFEWSGAACAAGTIIVFLPCSNCTEASLDMLGENGADRLREVEIACREAPRGLLRDLRLPGVRAVLRIVTVRLRRRRERNRPESGRGGPATLRTNADLLAALEVLGLTADRRTVKGRVPASG
ncbi:MAG: hypothetical protein GXP31_11850 [Kiritimatiellaeota bacterium]|nr:hypothetical protein [Kiritimatiellota bacterium]